MFWAFTSTAVPLLITDWDTSAPFCEYFTFTPGAHATSRLSGVITPECVPLSLTVYTYVIKHYRGYGLAVVVRNLSTNSECELYIDGIKSLCRQLDPLVESNGGMFTGLKFGVKKESNERSSPYVIDTQIAETQPEVAAETPTSHEEKLWRRISNRHGQ